LLRIPEFRAVTVRQKARRGPSAFTRNMDRANPEQARVAQRAYSWLQREAAAGVDSVTWDEYGKETRSRSVVTWCRSAETEK
jgi:hypothetical protein